MSLLSNQQDDQVMAEINITPFTDVLLVLLIIFMILAALITPPGFQKELPNKSSDSPQTQQDLKNKTIEVDVNDKGVIFVDGKRSDRSTSTPTWPTPRGAGDIHVSIIADAKAPYGTIIRILDAANDRRSRPTSAS